MSTDWDKIFKEYEEKSMACREQIDNYIPLVMEARQLMRACEATSGLPRSIRLGYLSEATDLVNRAIQDISGGRLRGEDVAPLTAMLEEIATMFISTAEELDA